MIRFELTLTGHPDLTLSGNYRGHSRAKASKIKTLRSLAKLLCLNQRDRPRGWKRATVVYEFYFSDDRKRDEANCIEALKPAIDGCQDAGIIPGDHWQVLSTKGVRSEIDRSNPRAVLIFEKVK